MTQENQAKIHEIVADTIPILKTDCPLKRIHKNGQRHMLTEKLKEIIEHYEQKGQDSEG